METEGRGRVDNREVASRERVRSEERGIRGGSGSAGCSGEGQASFDASAVCVANM